MPPSPPAEFGILTAKSPIEPDSLREQVCVSKCNLILMISLCYLFKTKSPFVTLTFSIMILHTIRHIFERLTVSTESPGAFFKGDTSAAHRIFLHNSFFLRFSCIFTGLFASFIESHFIYYN